MTPKDKEDVLAFVGPIGDRFPLRKDVGCRTRDALSNCRFYWQRIHVLLRLGCLGALTVPMAACSLPNYSQEMAPVSAPGNQSNQVALPRILIRFRTSDGLNTADIHAALGTRVVQRYEQIPGLEAVEVPLELSLDRILEAYRKNPLVLYAEPDQSVTTQGR